MQAYLVFDRMLYPKASVFLCALFLTISCVAAETHPKANKLFEAGLEAVEKDDYLLAVNHLEAAVKIDGSHSEYHRWLGRAYGLNAKYAAWYKAVGWAKKARASFEKAVDVEPENIEALLDLREFYRQAPGIVGGSDKKAKSITEKLMKLGYQDEPA